MEARRVFRCLAHGLATALLATMGTTRHSGAALSRRACVLPAFSALRRPTPPVDHASVPAAPPLGHPRRDASASRFSRSWPLLSEP